MSDQAIYWCGRNVDTMSAEELLVVVKSFVKLNQDDREVHKRTLEMWSAFQRARKAAR